MAALWHPERRSAANANLVTSYPLRPADAIESTAAGFSSAEMSPGSRPSQAARATRRMILPLRVRGRSGTATIIFGRTVLPMSRMTARRPRSRSSDLQAIARSRHAQDDDRLALELVGDADRGGLEHRRVGHRAGLHLGRADPLAGDLEGVVRSAVDVPVAIGVDGGPVAVDPQSRDPAPVGLEVALASGSAQNPRVIPGQRLPDGQLADGAADRIGPPRRRCRPPSRRTGR